MTLCHRLVLVTATASDAIRADHMISRELQKGREETAKHRQGLTEGRILSNLDSVVPEAWTLDRQA